MIADEFPFLVGRTVEQKAGDLLRLLNQRVVAASAEAGVLSLSFENGAELRAYPDEQYESWSVIGDGTAYQWRRSRLVVAGTAA